jgi:hypothetical protein
MLHCAAVPKEAISTWLHYMHGGQDTEAALLTHRERPMQCLSLIHQCANRYSDVWAPPGIVRRP